MRRIRRWRFSDYLFALNAREPVEEIFDGISTFEIIDQVLNRYARAGETGRAAHDFGIDLYDRTHSLETITFAR